MNKKIIIILSLVLIAIIASLIAVVFTFLPKSQTRNLDEFARCLAQKNITMYGTPWCEWCQKEETLFGKSFGLVPYIDCSKNSQECVAKGINGTPTWIFPDGRKIEGHQTLKQLSQESGCVLPETKKY